MEKLKSYFQSANFNEVDSIKIVSFFQKQTFDKDTFFVKEGKKSSQLAFVETGKFQYFSTTSQGDKLTTYIALENTFIASLLTYLSEIPAKENIRALENSVLWVIEKSDVITLQNQVSSFKDFYIKLIEEQICCIDNSRLDFITLTSEERYKKLLQEQPELLQKIPLQYIASMLGITPRHLSRLRNKI